MENKRVIILGYTLHDYKSQLKKGDLVYVDNCFYNIEKLDDTLNKDYKYYVKSKINGELMNFERSELSKANIAYFDYDLYTQHNIKKMIASIPLNDSEYIKDIIYIKAKFANEWEMGRSEFDQIQSCDFIDLDFTGQLINKTVTHYPDQPPINYTLFKINVPEYD